MKAIRNTLKRKWANYLLEIIVIMIGILGAFMLDRWNERRANNKLEKQYLQNLLTDIELDLENLKAASTTATRALDAKLFILGYIGGDDHPADSVFSNMADLMPGNKFIPTTVTMDELKSSSGFQTIRSIYLRREIATLYHHYELVQKFEEDYNYVRLRLQNIRIEDFTTASQNYIGRGLIDEPQKLLIQIKTNHRFKNALTSNLASSRDILFKETLIKVSDFRKILLKTWNNTLSTIRHRLQDIMMCDDMRPIQLIAYHDGWIILIDQ